MESINQLVAEKDTAYRERDMLVCALSKIWPSHLAYDDQVGWDDEWRWVVCVHSPQGQLTWHIRKSELPWFGHLNHAANHWDGHTTPEKYERLSRLTSQNESSAKQEDK